MSGRCKRTAPGTDLGDGRDWFPNGPPQQDRGQRALAERLRPFLYDSELAELERLQRIEALLREWWIKPTAANWIALRAALATDGAK